MLICGRWPFFFAEDTLSPLRDRVYHPDASAVRREPGNAEVDYNRPQAMA
jgi:hypothetical protein